MRRSRRVHGLAVAVLAVVSMIAVAHRSLGQEPFWNVDDIRPGMKGHGKTVIKGIKIETFHAEVIGVLRNSNPGRDLILFQLSGLDLEKSGVIQGMSGSPIYIEGKLVGAVAYAWPFGKVPIAGVTPFVQMREYASYYEKRDLAEERQPRRIGLNRPLKIEGQSFDTVTLSERHYDAQPTAADGLFLMPLRTPLAATGFSRNSLGHLGDLFKNTGLTPMQGGGVGGHVTEEERNARIEPGAGLAVALVMGDFDMSGIGTVTHVEGKRVYGWGHPFMGLGSCEFPLMTGYTHTIMPRLTISFKMGTPLRNVGLINADVSTCIAGWLDRPVDLLPVSAQVRRTVDGVSRAFNTKIVRQKQMVPGLVMAVLTNCVDMEGDLPEEMTARLKVKIHVNGRQPIVLDDVHSGANLVGNRGPMALYGQVQLLTQVLTNNGIGTVRIERIEAETEITPGRRTAEIESVEPESEEYAPGETVKVRVLVRPFKGPRQRLTVEVKLPVDLPDGSYTGLIGDETNNARQTLRDNPHLNFPTNLDNLVKAVETVASARRSTMVLRVSTQAQGVTVGDQVLPDLPASMIQILGNGRRSGAQPIAGSIVGRTETPWVLQGADSFRFQVTRNKRALADQR